MKHIVAATFLTLSCILHIQMQEACAQNAKHIIIDSSNNLHLDDEYFYLPLPISQKKKEVQLLREYVLERIKPRTSTDIEAFADIVTWVHERWEDR
jgi:hypothetical protein